MLYQDKIKTRVLSRPAVLFCLIATLDILFAPQHHVLSAKQLLGSCLGRMTRIPTTHILPMLHYNLLRIVRLAKVDLTENCPAH
jgi:hypothetical protein